MNLVTNKPDGLEASLCEQNLEMYEENEEKDEDKMREDSQGRGSAWKGINTNQMMLYC